MRKSYINQISSSNNQSIPKQSITRESINHQYESVIKSLASINKTKRPKSEKSLKNHIKSYLSLKESASTINTIHQKLLSDQKIYLDQSNKIDGTGLLKRDESLKVFLGRLSTNFATQSP